MSKPELSFISVKQSSAMLCWAFPDSTFAYPIDYCLQDLTSQFSVATIANYLIQ
jgi:hypothetical protein